MFLIIFFPILAKGPFPKLMEKGLFCMFQVTIEDKSEKLDVVAAVSDSDCARESPAVPGTEFMIDVCFR